MLMIMNAYEQDQRDANHHWGCNNNKETKEKHHQENKSLVDQKT